MKFKIVLYGMSAVVLTIAFVLALDYGTWLLYSHILHDRLHWPYLTFWDVVGLWLLIGVFGNCFRQMYVLSSGGK